MKKIPSLFVRDYTTKKVGNVLNPGSEWVAMGEGTATRKMDGIALLMKDGVPYKRYDAKTGRTPPETFVPAQEHPDPVTGHWPGWVPMKLPDDRILFEGLEWGKTNLFPEGIPDGTYEVCGPRIGTRHGKNPENLSEHRLYVHGDDVLADCPRDFEGLMKYLENSPMEGIVWHHPDGRMVKIKKNDFPYGPAPEQHPTLELDNSPP